MNAEEFWQLIALARKSVQTTIELPGWLQMHLSKQSTGYIAEYYRYFSNFSRISYDARLWAAAGLIMKFCSDDKFTDFRAWLIAKGRHVYEPALLNPDSLAEIEIDGDFGLPILFRMGNVAEKAYRERAGEMADITDLVPNSAELILLNPDAYDGDRSKLATMFPRLFAKFGS